MSTSHTVRPIPKSRECCIHEAIHSRKMEGIHNGMPPRRVVAPVELHLPVATPNSTR
jgi:hypothetical protein